MRAMLSLLLLSGCLTATVLACGEVCYEEVECFTDCPPFDIFPFPRDPDYIGTQFRLYTSASGEDYTNITKDDLGDFTAQTTWFITHGFASRGDDPWVLRLKDQLLQQAEMNVVVIDWRKGARPDPEQPVQPVPASNSRVVARVTRNLIQSMQTTVGLSLSDVHCGGHSVGSHVCAFLGKEFTSPKIARISGFDPAGDVFDVSSTEVRLTPTDATYVDAIHTNARGIASSGIDQNVGHADFWPHRGNRQPGCGGGVCDHMRAIYLFTESINSVCPFNSRVCSSYEDMMLEGACDIRSCSGPDCGRMGYHSNTRSSGTFYLDTNEDEPYCQPCC